MNQNHMFYSLSDVRKLAKMRTDERDVLSLYVDTSLKTHTKSAVRAQVTEQLKAARTSFSAKEYGVARAFVRGKLKFGPRGMAFFYSASLGIAHVLELPRSVRTQSSVGEFSVIRPLVELLDEYERFAVVIVSRKQARLFTVYLGEIEEQKHLLSDHMIPRQRQGGWSQSRFQRHRKESDNEFYALIAKELATLRKKHSFDRLIVAGPAGTRTRFEKVLPKTLLSRVVADTTIQGFRDKEALLTRVMKIESQVEAEKEEELLARFQEMHGQKGRIVDGVESIDAALADHKRIELLLVDGKFNRRSVVERLVRETLAQGGRVEIFRHATGMSDHEDIAAILRTGR